MIWKRMKKGVAKKAWTSSEISINYIQLNHAISESKEKGLRVWKLAFYRPVVDERLAVLVPQREAHGSREVHGDGTCHLHLHHQPVLQVQPWRVVHQQQVALETEAD
jgi:hypothetical protein